MLEGLIRLVKGKKSPQLIPIGVAMTPQFKRLLDSQSIKIGYTQGSSGIFTGLKVYVWDDLPIPCKLYYRQDVIDFDCQMYCTNFYGYN
jgi:hypothetical protein